MSSDNILVEFTNFLEKSAMVMMGGPQPPAANEITADTGTPMAPAASSTAAPAMPTRAASLVSPTIAAQSMPRVAAMPASASATTSSAPKALTDTSKAMKTTNFSPKK